MFYTDWKARNQRLDSPETESITKEDGGKKSMK